VFVYLCQYELLGPPECSWFPDQRKYEFVYSCKSIFYSHLCTDVKLVFTFCVNPIFTATFTMELWVMKECFAIPFAEGEKIYESVRIFKRYGIRTFFVGTYNFSVPFL